MEKKANEESIDWITRGAEDMADKKIYMIGIRHTASVQEVRDSHDADITAAQKVLNKAFDKMDIQIAKLDRKQTADIKKVRVELAANAKHLTNAFADGIRINR